MLKKTYQKINFWKITSFEKFGVKALFFQRKGGFSNSPYNTLNLGLNTKDESENIRKNREKILEIIEPYSYLPVCANQIHENNIKIISSRHAGQGWQEYSTAIPNTDGLITSMPGLPLAITVADCLPVLIADEAGKVVAAIHAGWRGLVKKIISKAIKKIKEEFDISSNSLKVALGPAIGPKAFKINGDTLACLSNLDPKAVCEIGLATHKGFDLWQAAQNELITQGIKKNKITIIRECTFSHAKEYFSFRRDGETGRMLGIIQILPHIKLGL